MTEIWKDIKGYEGRYRVSDQGRIESVPFKQRYLLRTGAEAYRQTKARIIAQNIQNSGYALVHLHLNNARKACLVHRIVAEHFLKGDGATVNHKDGCKTNNAVHNLEWATYTQNHLHAVRTGLKRQAIKVRDPATGAYYPSISQAAKQSRKSHRKVRATFVLEVAPCLK